MLSVYIALQCFSFIQCKEFSNIVLFMNLSSDFELAVALSVFACSTCIRMLAVLISFSVF